MMMMSNMWKRTIAFWALSATLLLVNVNNHEGKRINNIDLFQPVAAVSDFLKPTVTSTIDTIAGNDTNGKGKEKAINERTFLRKRTNNNKSNNDVAKEQVSIETSTTIGKDKRMLEDPGTGEEGDTGESDNSAAFDAQVQIAVLVFTCGTIFMPCGIGILFQLLACVILLFAFVTNFGFSLFM